MVDRNFQWKFYLFPGVKQFMYYLYGTIKTIEISVNFVLPSLALVKIEISLQYVRLWLMVYSYISFHKFNYFKSGLFQQIQYETFISLTNLYNSFTRNKFKFLVYNWKALSITNFKRIYENKSLQNFYVKMSNSNIFS